ncbi:hypothetical protein C8R46DRAFT_268276 [Mycena filopes]|nr:hypothetical protein C8R46DRAFT_268276 [Mycena filopes]
MASNSLPLNDDIIDRIFTFCADFHTLLALQSTCKPLYAIFRTHPNSITLAVARNLTDSFPDALRALRQKTDEGTVEESDDNEASPDIAEQPEPENLDPVTVDELPQLRKNDAVVQKLECIFSNWYKDRKAPASVLSPEESFRFRRAMYRVMLFSARFTSIGCDIYDDDDWPSDWVLRKRRFKALAVYATAELCEIHSVVLFLKGMIHLVVPQVQGDDGTTDVCLAAGPALILATYESRDADTMAAVCPFVDYGDPTRFLGFFYDPMAEIWAARELEAQPPDDSAHLRSILETVPDGLDSCSRCGESTHEFRWTSETWQHYTTDLPYLLPGALSLDRQETTALQKVLQENTDTLPHLDVLIAGIFREVVPLNAGFEGWNEEDALCGNCLEKLLKEHTYLWLLKRKMHDGWVPPEDCWYGYDCRTQLKNAEHAMAKNHLCKPTKGSRIAVIHA